MSLLKTIRVFACAHQKFHTYFNAIHGSRVSSRSKYSLGLVMVSLFLSQNAVAQVTKFQEVETAGLYVQLMRDMPKSTVLINSPYPQALGGYGGLRTSMDKESEIKGGHALKIRVRKVSKEVYNQGLVTKTVDQINAGDTLCLIYWARGLTPGEGRDAPSIGMAGVQQVKAPNTRIMGLNHELFEEWAPYVNKVEATESYKAGAAEIFFHLGNRKQKIEIGPVFLFNLGQNIPLDFQSNACGKL